MVKLEGLGQQEPPRVPLDVMTASELMLVMAVVFVLSDPWG